MNEISRPVASDRTLAPPSVLARLAALGASAIITVTSVIALANYALPADDGQTIVATAKPVVAKK